ncbi:sulfotransferase family protein [Thioflexithrix psekupsensis]|uniref:Sulfotransferase family protein n=1 Tax=Thioflexithrix psekupsensis TaxID=1570016 RepID=A0A251X5S9_9GAMM|nr:sulfotransferase [Thioflexithrix psekupsensis]OUD12458.1 hypothetical protein TPSD3_15235 [Thioflexithrix psekupsensis]
MMQTMNDRSPVVIGGMGGSGTRVVADIVRQAGFYIGNFLNHANDNLWFTFLFKRPLWYSFAHENRQTLQETMALFEQIMTGQFKESPQVLFTLSKAAKDYLQWQKNYHAEFNITVPLDKPEMFVQSVVKHYAVDLTQQFGWGWKEPNSHLYVQALSDYFPHIRYVHLIRHGLDMAYSNNQQQYFNWGASLFGVEWIKNPEQRPYGALEYWLKANQAAIETGQRHLKDRFLLIYFEQLCQQPKVEIQRLLDFIGADQITETQLLQLCQLPKMPSSYQRYQAENLSLFTAEQLTMVQELGYSI